jgi:hypothetical protein
MDNDAYVAVWGAVLTQAIDDVIAMRADRCTLDQRRTVVWIYSDSREPRSFLWVCDMCRIDHVRVRRMLRG